MAGSPMTPSSRTTTTRLCSPNAFTSPTHSTAATKAKLVTHIETGAVAADESGVGSNPVTPLKATSHDLTAGITSSLRIAKLDPAIKTTISNSPTSSRDTNPHGSFANHRGHHNVYQDGSTPSSSATRGDPARPTSTKSSPSNVRHFKKQTPAWREGGERDAVRITLDHPDDPFLISNTEQQKLSSTPSVSLSLNPNKLGMTPTNNTAQAIFSPQACVFVANLTQSETDEQLEQAVTQVFQQFGHVYVKIRRDGRQMPFAFAQYTNVDDAQRAIALGRGLLINGRPCRTEVARVNRSLYLSKINGGTISESDAGNIMDGHGPIEMLWYATQTEREMFGLPEGIFVRFAFFDDCRDAIASFRESNTYRLEQVKGLDESRTTPGRGSPGYVGPFRRESPGRLVSPFLGKRAADAKSIFVGNVPPHLSEEQLVGMFQMYGRIQHVEIIRKPSIVSSSGVNAFAFIDFEAAQAAALAVQAGPRVYQDLHLRVEHKDISNLASRGSNGFSGSPLRKGLLDSQDILVAFQRGVSVGMSQASQAQLIPQSFYPQYQYYPTYDTGLPHSHGLTASGTDSAATSGTGYSNSYVATLPASSTLALAPPQFGNCSQGQHYLTSTGASAPYQWPAPNFDEYGVPFISNSQELQ